MGKGVMNTLRTALLGLPRRKKRMIQVAADIVVVWVVLWLAFVVRLGVDEMINPFRDHLWLFIAAPIVAIPLFIRFGMYRAVMRYFGNDALIAIIKAVSLSSLILGVVVYWYGNHQNVVPRSIIFSANSTIFTGSPISNTNTSPPSPIEPAWMTNCAASGMVMK